MSAEAIEQARSAGAHETVARLLAANFEEFQRLGRYASISSWSASLPEEMVRQRPRLALNYAAVAMDVDNNNQAVRRLTSWAEEAIEALEDRGGFDPSDDVDGTVIGFEGLDALKGELLALKLSLSARNLPPEEIAAIASQALELLPPSKHRVRGMLHMMGAGIEMTVSELKAGLPNLEKSLDEARRAQNPPLLTSILTRAGQAYLVMGRLEDGRRSFEEALLAGQEVSTEANLLMCGPHTGLAEVLLERGDLAAAADHAAKALEFAGKSRTRSPVLFARTTAAQVMLAAGDSKAAIEQLAEAQGFVRGSRDSRFVSFLTSVKLKIYCGSGDLESAGNIVRDRDLSPDVVVDLENEEEITAYGRYLAARGESVEAVQVLSRVLPVVQGAGRVQARDPCACAPRTGKRATRGASACARVTRKGDHAGRAGALQPDVHRRGDGQFRTRCGACGGRWARPCPGGSGITVLPHLPAARDAGQTRLYTGPGRGGRAG